VVAGRYLAYHKRALRRFGIELRHGRDEVGVMLLGMQRKCFTYVSVTPTMHESGLAKINLHPDDWRDPADRARYIDAMQPEVIAGDPISFAELLALPVGHRPAALISVAMTLSPALRSQLEERFACPVLDVYSMNEAGPLAVHDPALDGYALLQPGMYVEILDAKGSALPEGQVGEIALTGGFNFCLPLVRYRTGDQGALFATPTGPVIRQFQGRRPVRFLTARSNWLNNIDLTHALASLPLSRYTVHQAADGEVTLRLPIAEMAFAGEGARRLSLVLEGRDVHVVGLDIEDKALQYTTDLEGGMGT
jgi:phenylacetate-CoA ligase